jgi:hypothetical protein
MSDYSHSKSRKTLSEIPLNAKGYPTVGMLRPKSTQISNKNKNILKNIDIINNVCCKDFTKKKFIDDVNGDTCNNKLNYDK